jgi:hypothetical protein
MPELSETAVNNFEHLVDYYGIENIVRALSHICSEKSIHIAENWQDTNTAKVWMGYSVILDGALQKIESEGL